MVNNKSYNQAIRLLQKASTPYGFVAAVQEHDNYKRVWTRDGVIISVAALLSGEENLIRTAKATLETIFNHQNDDGIMPSNVSPNNEIVSYGGTAGRADNPSWAVIGLCAYSILTKDNNLWQKYLHQVDNCFRVLNSWEFNGKQLIYVPQSGDWADEYIQHGYILFDQLLRLWALRLAMKISPNPVWNDKIIQITAVIQANYWRHEKQIKTYSPNLVHQMGNASKDYWLMGFNPSRIYNYFDLQANTFSILLGIGTETQNESVLNYLKQRYHINKSLLPSFYPTIEKHDTDMNELKSNYAYTFRNKPGYFHNGGLWPVWNGWLVAALALNNETDLAKNILMALHDANAQDDLFNECLQGTTLKPCGVPNCTWSAAGAVIAEQALINHDFKLLFNFN